MAPLAGLEPATHGLEIRCSIQLSYRGTMDDMLKCRWICENITQPQTADKPADFYECSAMK
jgi:hypothetical protein